LALNKFPIPAVQLQIEDAYLKQPECCSVAVSLPILYLGHPGFLSEPQNCLLYIPSRKLLKTDTVFCTLYPTSSFVVILFLKHITCVIHKASLN